MISTGKELRQAYLEFFKERPDFPHPVIASAPLVPPDDPTLLFTTAGMVQFKQLYSGLVDPLPYSRSTSCQKCLRAGGKGSDLENVGKTLRHHTFFEMLGNFSFGDYFKKETIKWAWQFVTEVMNLPEDRLFPTIFEDDDEAEKLWNEETGCVYTPLRLPASENFWGPAGDTGACGPCSELCIFLGTDEELQEIKTKLKESPEEYRPVLARRIEEEGDLFLEIWNMVFPQFDQQKDGSRLPLKHKGIDTGAGLERMTVALKFAQTGKPSTPYETDLMWPIIEAASNNLGVPYLKISEPHSEEAAKERLALNAIADHTRALVFTLAEGITPSNVGRGYVLRRIQRRALRFASLLGVDKPFMTDLYDSVVDAMGDVYPEIKSNPDFIRKAIKKEEETFLHTRDRGTKILDELVKKAVDSGTNEIPGADVFKLWDTYGFPIDLTIEIAEDEGIRIDRAGYEESMKKQKEEARKSWKGAKLDFELDLLDELHEEHGSTEFLGYDSVGPVDAEVIGFIHKGSISKTMKEGEEGLVVLNQTPFYAESGGQVGDTGVIETGHGTFVVTDCQKTPHDIYIHHGKMKSGTLEAGDKVTTKVDRERRDAIRRNHSSVHLLQAALKNLVGDHVTQAGSYVGPTSSRFDFSHSDSLTKEELVKIEREVNRMIVESQPVKTEVLSLEDAKKKGAIAPFGEKYGAVVRVVSMGEDSIEFCGGTHVNSTGEIARYRIVSESSIASGIRRIEAVTANDAMEQELTEHYEIIAPLESTLAAKGTAILERVSGLQSRVKELEKELAKLRQQAATKDVDKYIDEAVELEGGLKLVRVRMDNLDNNQLRTLGSQLRDKLGDKGVVCILSASGEKVAIIAAVGKEAQKSLPAGQIVNKVAEPLGGRGGGRPDFAQGGAKEVGKIDEVLSALPELLKS